MGRCCLHLDEGLRLETVFTSKMEMVPHLLSGYTEISIHNRTTVEFVLGNVNEIYSIEILSSGIKCSEV
jgi:hypothetical protein